MILILLVILPRGVGCVKSSYRPKAGTLAPIGLVLGQDPTVPAPSAQAQLELVRKLWSQTANRVLLYQFHPTN